ncbi:MAG: GIY-YIG nuclease family protein [Candidatus Levybacteria bacterium]|nr:GIY-YIG nuclease family protein [Candidatus Levybacteria bacterium]MBP9815545.1 GIY-YIG nuclease family protein [Candidatus Levybacteria bacterium]
MNYFVYIVECSDKSLYTGFTTDIKRRISQHNLKKGGAKSIRGKLPVTLVYSEKFETINDALKRESEIKSWPRAEKIKLIKKRLC